jgi:hypothetical protein
MVEAKKSNSNEISVLCLWFPVSKYNDNNVQKRAINTARSDTGATPHVMQIVKEDSVP